MKRIGRLTAIAAICAAGLPVASLDHPASAASARHYTRQIHPLIGDDEYLIYAVGPARRNGRLGTPVATFVRAADGTTWRLPHTHGKWLSFSLAKSSLITDASDGVRWWNLAKRTSGRVANPTGAQVQSAAPGGFFAESSAPITNATQLTLYHRNGSHDPPFVVSLRGVGYDVTPSSDGYLLSFDAGAKYASWDQPTQFQQLATGLSNNEDLDCSAGDFERLLAPLGSLDSVGAGCRVTQSGAEDSWRGRAEFIPLGGAPRRGAWHGRPPYATAAIGRTLVYTLGPAVHPRFYALGPNGTTDLGRISTAQPFSAYGELVRTSRTGTRLIASTARNTRRHTLVGIGAGHN